MKIIVYMGSFNPIHIGHTALANYALEYIGADRLYFMLSPQNPHKKDNEFMDYNTKSMMLKNSIYHDNRFFISELETSLPSPYYTFNSLNAFEILHSDAEIFILIGADSLVNIRSWYKGDMLLSKYNFIVYPRLGYDLTEFEKVNNIKILKDAPYIAISSTMIREAIEKKQKMSYYLPNPALWNDLERLYRAK